MELVSRRVCASCNSGWMSRLETWARPILTPMILGQPTELNANAQKIIALWSFKTALMLNLTLPRAMVPMDHLKSFYETGHPPGHGDVYLSGFAGDALSWYHVRGIDFLDPHARQMSWGYVLTFTVGRIAAHCFGHIGPQRIETRPPREIRMGLIRIWPERQPLRRWPPLMALNDHTLDMFSKLTMAPILNVPKD